METKTKSGLDSLWFGKNGNTMESLLFAVFLFLFSFALATAPDAMRPGAQVVVGMADGIGRGYEMTIRRLDQNVAVLPEISAGMQREIGTRFEAMQTHTHESVQRTVALLQMPSTKLVRWQGVSVNRPYR